MDVLYACTDQCDIALEVLRLNEELGLDAVPKMYAMALEVTPETGLSCLFQVLAAHGRFQRKPACAVDSPALTFVTSTGATLEQIAVGTVGVTPLVWEEGKLMPRSLDAVTTRSRFPTRNCKIAGQPVLLRPR